jgi:hypothetical protein
MRALQQGGQNAMKKALAAIGLSLALASSPAISQTQNWGTSPGSSNPISVPSPAPGTVQPLHVTHPAPAHKIPRPTATNADHSADDLNAKELASIQHGMPAPTAPGAPTTNP